jgi:hypothetical protein
MLCSSVESADISEESNVRTSTKLLGVTTQKIILFLADHAILGSFINADRNVFP